MSPDQIYVGLQFRISIKLFYNTYLEFFLARIKNNLLSAYYLSNLTGAVPLWIVVIFDLGIKHFPCLSNCWKQSIEKNY